MHRNIGHLQRPPLLSKICREQNCLWDLCCYKRKYEVLPHVEMYQHNANPGTGKPKHLLKKRKKKKVLLQLLYQNVQALYINLSLLCTATVKAGNIFFKQNLSFS